MSNLAPCRKTIRTIGIPIFFVRRKLHMKDFIAKFMSAVDLRHVLVCYHKSRLLTAQRDMKQFGTETTMPVWCSQRFTHHHRALQRLGFVKERVFSLQQRPITDPSSYRTLRHLACARFPDGYWSYGATGARVTVTAPPAQMSDWEQFLSDFDSTAPNQGVQ